ncbi:MAG: MFS transporter [Gammaproteobacteria bacterium]
MNTSQNVAVKMSQQERRAALSLASIYALRMLGLFMILPVFSLYADELDGATPALAGLAIGIYGMTQAILQIPFGLVSDRIGRKPVIIFGLLVFVAGSLVAAAADSIGMVILGRALQGSGAIAAAVMALAADLTREEQRVKTMAIIGMSIGASFAMAIILGPILNTWIGVPGIFTLTAVLALAGIAVVAFIVPDPVVSRVHRDAETVPAQLGSILRDSQLLRLDIGILILHMILTATFVVLPLVLRDQAGFDPVDHWKLYLPVLLISLPLAIPFILQAEKYGRIKQVFLGAIIVIVIAEIGLFSLHQSIMGIAIMLAVFYAGFNLLEAILPSLISKVAPADGKGTAMGVYSSSQFFGAFLGGSLGGWLHGHYGLTSVFLFCGAAAVVWFLIAMSMQQPGRYKSRLLRIDVTNEQEARTVSERLAGIAGVVEVVVVAEENLAYLKVEQKNLDEDALAASLAG